MSAVISLLVAVFFAATQTNPAPADVVEAEKTGIYLEGTILNSVTGEPVPRADVTLQRNQYDSGPGPSEYSQSSDAKGKFVFDNVDPGLYNLRAVKTAFVVTPYRQIQTVPPGPATLLSINHGQNLTKLDIRMVPQGVIVGRLINEDGEPIANSPVLWFQYVYIQGKRKIQRGGYVPGASGVQVQTNDQGEYRFANLQPGEYFVAAMMSLPTVRSGDLSGTSVPQVRNATTFYPNVLDPAVAVPVTVPAGIELRANIHVRRGTVHSIRGKVTGGANNVTALRVQISRTDGIAGAQGATQVRSDGSFEFPYVFPGSYVLNAGLDALTLNQNGGVSPFSGSLDVRMSDRDIEGLTLHLVPTTVGGINGTVRVVGSDLQAILKPPATTAGPLGANTPARSGLNIALREPGENCPSGGRVWPVAVDGTFQTQQIVPSKYVWCVATLPPGTFVKSARFNEQDVTRTLIDTTNLGGGTLEIVLSTKAADLTGAVADDKGELKAGPVTLWLKTSDPANSNGGAYVAGTDQYGKFRFSGLPPGSYYIAGFEEALPQGLARSPEFLFHFNGEAATVTIEEGGHTIQNAKFIRAGRIAAEIAKLP